jgi:hypothetical protein
MDPVIYLCALSALLWFWNALELNSLKRSIRALPCKPQTQRPEGCDIRAVRAGVGGMASDVAGRRVDPDVLHGKAPVTGSVVTGGPDAP